MSYFDNLILLAMAQGENSPIATKEGVIEAINNAIAALPRGLIYKGAVDYYSGLPESPEVGDCYTVRYEGDSGTTPNGKEYAWGPIDNVNQWIDLGPDLSGYVEKQDGGNKVYVNDVNGIPSVLSFSKDTANGSTFVQRTGAGKIVCNDPTNPGHAATKKYVDNLISSAVVDFNGSYIDTPTTEVGLKVYAAMKTFGFFVPAHTAGNSTIFARPLTDSEVTIPANTFAFSAIQATSTGLTDSYSSGLYYTVDSTGVITAVV